MKDSLAELIESINENKEMKSDKTYCRPPQSIHIQNEMENANMGQKNLINSDLDIIREDKDNSRKSINEITPSNSEDSSENNDSCPEIKDEVKVELRPEIADLIYRVAYKNEDPSIVKDQMNTLGQQMSFTEKKQQLMALNSKLGIPQLENIKRISTNRRYSLLPSLIPLLHFRKKSKLSSDEDQSVHNPTIKKSSKTINNPYNNWEIEEDEFVDETYKVIMEAIKKAEDERIEKERELKLKEDEAKQKIEVKEEQKVSKDEVVNNEVDETMAKVIENLLNSTHINDSIKNIILQLADDDIERLNRVQELLEDFFNEKEFPEFYGNALKDPKFTFGMTLANNRRITMNEDIDNTEVETDQDWSSYQKKFEQMKLNINNKRELTELEQGRIIAQNIKNFKNKQLIKYSDYNIKTKNFTFLEKIIFLKNQLKKIKACITNEKKLLESIKEPFMKSEEEKQNKYANLSRKRRYKVNITLQIGRAHV